MFFIRKYLFFCILCLMLFPARHTPICAAAENSTILSGKVVSPVTRAPTVPFNAIVDKVLVKPGDAVTEGQGLLTYHLQEEAERILQREVLMGAGTEGSKSQLLNLERELVSLMAQRNKARQLVSSKLGSPQALERLEGDVKSLQGRIGLLKSNIQKSETAFQARLRELEGYFGTPIKEGATLPHSLTLTAPIAGHVLSVSGSLHPGGLLHVNAAPIAIGEMNPMFIQVNVYEAEIGSIHVGNTATVQIPSLNDKEFAAEVTSIAWTSNDMDVTRPSFYAVSLTVPNPDLELKPGFKAVVRFGNQRKP